MSEEKMDDRDLVLQSEIEQLKAENARLKETIRYAIGEIEAILHISKTHLYGVT